MTQAAGERIVLDVGNSAATVACCVGQNVRSVASVIHAGVDPTIFDERLRDAIAAAPETAPIGIAHVNAVVTDRIVAAIGARRRVLVAPRDFAPAVKNACDFPETVGLDRLFNANAVARDEDFVIVDAGSAITVDKVARAVFLGGAIAPGMRMAYRALSRETGQLPLLEPVLEPPRAPATHTHAAIHAGVRIGLAGAVDRLISDLLESFEPAHRSGVSVILTGGDAALFSLLLRTPHTIDSTLTLRGIARSLDEALR